MTPLPARRSVVWSAVFRVGYRILRLVDPLVRSLVANDVPGLGGVVELWTVGRRSGLARRTLVTLLTVDGVAYAGHPNGTAAWIANAEAAGWARVGDGFLERRVSVSPVPFGAERDAVIRSTWSQQPFPANVLYRAARRHVAAAGVYLRLGEPRTVGDEAGADGGS
jgi:hypothetical protein